MSQRIVKLSPAAVPVVLVAAEPLKSLDVPADDAVTFIPLREAEYVEL